LIITEPEFYRNKVRISPTHFLKVFLIVYLLDVPPVHKLGCLKEKVYERYGVRKWRSLSELQDHLSSLRLVDDACRQISVSMLDIVY
jgi:hypothetical protein